MHSVRLLLVAVPPLLLGLVLILADAAPPATAQIPPPQRPYPPQCRQAQRQSVHPLSSRATVPR